MWQRVIEEAPVDAVMLHNHYSLIDTRALELLDAFATKDIGVINASPFASSLLTPGPVAPWHPANTRERALLAAVADYCDSHGFSIAKLAFQFSTQQDYFPTTLFSSARRQSLQRNLASYKEPINREHLEKVQNMLSLIMNKQWDYD
jgi:aryl-alcohol dehydrogenase-like predicted oxidoreductase